MFLVGAQRDGGFVIGTNRVIGIGEKVNFHTTDSSGAEFDIARTRSRVSHLNLLVPQACNQRLGDRARGALGKMPAFGVPCRAQSPTA